MIRISIVFLAATLLLNHTSADASDWDDDSYPDDFGRTVVGGDYWSITQYCVNGVLFAVYRSGSDGSATMIQKPDSGGTIACDDKKEFYEERRKEQVERDKAKVSEPLPVPG